MRVSAVTEIRIATLLRAALLCMVIANLGRIPVFSTGGRDVPVLLNDFALAGLVAAGCLAMVAHRSLVIDRVMGYALLFAGIGALSAVLAIPRFGLDSFGVAVSLLYLVRWLFYFATYVVVINCVRTSSVEGVWRALEAAILIFAAFGIFQSAFLPDFAQTVYPEARKYYDWDPQGHRLVSTLLDPNFAGGFIVIGLLVSLSRLAAGARVGSWKLLLLTVALVLTASRSSILAFLVGSGVIVLVRGVSKRMLRAIGVGAVLLLAALPKLIAFGRAYNKFQIDASALARVTGWLHGLQVLRDHWLIGIGFNTWGFVQESYGWPRLYAATYAIDGGLLFIAVMTGFVGLGVYLMMLWTVIRRARRVWRNTALPSGHRGLGIGAIAVIPAIVVHSIFINSLMHPQIMESLWVIWALVVCADQAPEEAPAVARAPRATARLIALADAR